MVKFATIKSMCPFNTSQGNIAAAHWGDLQVNLTEEVPQVRKHYVFACMKGHGSMSSNTYGYYDNGISWGCYLDLPPIEPSPMPTGEVPNCANVKFGGQSKRKVLTFNTCKEVCQAYQTPDAFFSSRISGNTVTEARCLCGTYDMCAGKVSPAPTPTPTDPPSSGGLSGVAVAGIVIAVVAVAGIGGFFYYKYSQADKNDRSGYYQSTDV